MTLATTELLDRVWARVGYTPRRTVTPLDTTDFEAFCARHLVIQDKGGRLIPFVPNRVQCALIAGLTGYDLVLKARQVGVSTAIQAWFFYLAMRGYARTSTLCHEDDLTQELRAMADRFYDHLPGEVRPEREYANAKLTTYPALHSQSRIATVGGAGGPTGQGQGRGGPKPHAAGPGARGAAPGALGIPGGKGVRQLPLLAPPPLDLRRRQPVLVD